jgi:hypothetical protein
MAPSATSEISQHQLVVKDEKQSDNGVKQAAVEEEETPLEVS